MRANNIAISRTVGMTLMFFIGWAILTAGRMGGFTDGCFGPVAPDLHVTYATYAEMAADGAVMHGWVPEFAPQSASRIEECHNPERSASWLRFSAHADDITVMASKLLLVPRDAVVFPDAPPNVAGPWWPESLADGGAQTVEYRFFIHYDTLSERQFVAIDSTTNTVWHWSP